MIIRYLVRFNKHRASLLLKETKKVRHILWMLFKFFGIMFTIWPFLFHINNRLNILYSFSRCKDTKKIRINQILFRNCRFQSVSAVAAGRLQIVILGKLAQVTLGRGGHRRFHFSSVLSKSSIEGNSDFCSSIILLVWYSATPRGKLERPLNMSFWGNPTSSTLFLSKIHLPHTNPQRGRGRWICRAGRRRSGFRRTAARLSRVLY